MDIKRQPTSISPPSWYAFGRQVVFDQFALYALRSLNRALSYAAACCCWRSACHRLTSKLQYLFESVQCFAALLTLVTRCHTRHTSLSRRNQDFRLSSFCAPVLRSKSSAMVGPKRSLQKLSRQSSLLFH